MEVGPWDVGNTDDGCWLSDFGNATTAASALETSVAIVLSCDTSARLPCL